MKTVFILSLVVISNFVFSQNIKPTSNTEMMIGTVERGDFQKSPYHVWFYNEYNTYLIDTAALNQIQLNDYKLKIYFGSWCSDSRREVPRFIKILDYLNFDYKKIEFIGLDRNKTAPNYKENIWDIQYVPTFIIFKDDIEKGRIIETPEDTLEKDFANIILK